MSLNGISTATNGSALDTKIYRRALKLDQAAAKRQAIGTNGYRALNIISGTHEAYVNGSNGAELVSLSGSASPTLGSPWSTGTSVATYGAEFRTWIGDLSGTYGETTSTCNEGDIIYFDFYGTNIPSDETSYIQFSGANITNQDATFPFPSNLLDPIPLGIMVSGDIYPGALGAPMLINADNLTEGNETLTVGWYINSGTLATSTSITIVDTSITPVGLFVDWYGSTSYIEPLGSYSIPQTGAVALPVGSYVDVGQNLQGTTFTVTVDADLNSAGSPWVILWGNDDYGTQTGYLMHWTTTTLGKLGIFRSRFVNSTTPNITTAGRQLYTCVVDGLDVAFYINGSLINSGTLSGSPTTIPNNNFYVGARHNNAGAAGTFADAKGGIYYSVKVEGTALTAGDVLAAYNAWAP